MTGKVIDTRKISQIDCEHDVCSNHFLRHKDKEAKKALALTATMKIPFTDIKPIISEYCNGLFQSQWSQECEKSDNKLYNIQKDLKQMPSPDFNSRSEETTFYRCLIGHCTKDD